MDYIIYRFTNKVNNKQYIGMTTQTLKRRIYQHWCVAAKNPRCHFHKALMKYGEDAWEVDTLASGTVDSIHEVKCKEQLYIAEHNTYEGGYNSTKGGEDFLSSSYQRELQLQRVRRGTHPFTGGAIQRESMKRRHAQGEFLDQNKKRIEAGTHNFQGNSNPAKRLGQEGRHHNQQAPWTNTKTKSNVKAMEVWLMADKLYEWYQEHGKKPRGGSYRAMAAAFNSEANLTSVVNKFRKGWVPTQDPSWLEFVSLNP